MMSCMMESEAFLYPMLLPPVPFLTSHKPTGPNFFTSSEDMLLAICLDQVTQLMDDNKSVYKKRSLVDIAQLITQINIPRSAPCKIAAHIRKRKASKEMNPIKAFYENGKPPIVCHYVIPVVLGKKLHQQPPQLLPEVWRSFLAVAYKKKEIGEIIREKEKTDEKVKPRVNNAIKKQPENMSKEKKKQVVKPMNRVEERIIGDVTKTNKPKISRKETKMSNNKEISKNRNRITINNIIQSASTANNNSMNLIGKPKTTKKDICNMLARKTSIQQAVKLNGLSVIDSDLTTMNNKSANISSKITTQSPLLASKEKSRKKENALQKSSVKSNVKISNLISTQKTDDNKFESIKINKCKSKVKMDNKKIDDISNMTKNSVVESVVPKMKFRVVSKGFAEHKEDDSLLAAKMNDASKHEHLKSLGLSPNKTVKNINNGFAQSAEDISNHLRYRLFSESDSVQSNSVESERTPLCVNIVKSCGRVESHSPRPPSTVKLKDGFVSHSIISLFNEKTKVPSNKYSQLNGSR